MSHLEQILLLQQKMSDEADFMFVNLLNYGHTTNEVLRAPFQRVH